MTSPNSPTLQQLHNLDTSSPSFQDKLCNIICGKEYSECVRDLEGDDPVWLVNYLDKILDILEPSSVASRKCLRELRSVCGKMQILPTSCTLPPHDLYMDPEPFALGGFGDVYRGTFGGSRVCIKCIRVSIQQIQHDPGKVPKDFCREAVMWKRMVHPNVVPLLGITTSQQFQLISNWMSGGDLLAYIKKNPDVNRLGLLCDVANGLHHLHLCNVIHGDLKGPNVLVDEFGHARLADFGFSMVARNLDSIQGDSDCHGFTPRWSAPEVLEHWSHSKEADTFSFGMVMYEAFTGAVPFSGKSGTVAMCEILKGGRPPRPTQPRIAKRLWSLMERCWDSEPHLRPGISEALKILLDANVPAKDRPTAGTLATEDRTLKAMAISSDTPRLTGLLTTSPSSPALQKLHNLEIHSPDFQDQLFNAVCEKEYAECVLDLEGDDPTWLVNFLDKALNILQPSGVASRKCLDELRSICGNRGILPTSYTLPLHLLDIHRRPFASGDFGDVYQGTFDGSRVCIKHLRVSAQDDPKRILKDFCKEAVVWKRMTHPNIVPLLGITTPPLPQLISDWMPGEDLPKYLKKCPNADRRELLADVANGLNYLHSCSVIHGDLKGRNVLVDGSGRACIADFGLTKITKHPHSVQSATQRHGLALQWSAPEVLKEGAYSKKADVFSFGMVVYEVLTDAVPFGGERSTAAAFAIMDGRRPPRPTHPIFPEELWSLVEHCWDHDPRLRPEVVEVLDTLLNLNIPAEVGLIIQAPVPEDHTPETVATPPDTPLPPTSPTCLPDHPVLQQLRDLDTSSSEFHLQLNSALYRDDYTRCVTNLQGNDLAWLVDFLDNALGGLAPSSETFRKCLRELRGICGTKMILPASFTPLHRLTTSNEPFASGGCGDVYRGILDGSKVCVKRVRVYAINDQGKAAKTFCGMAVAWKYLKHPSIVPLLGATTTPLQLVSDLVPGRDLLYSIKDHNINRLTLLSDTAEGLYYLHSCNVIHGDLKGHNILVDDSGHARITDFGLALVIQGLNSTRSASSYGSHAPRWTAPEVLESGVFSKKSDVFSFAMVMIEAFTGAVPFNGIRDVAAIHAIMRGERPPRPRHPAFTTELWELTQCCWNQDLRVRLAIPEVLSVLHGVNHSTWKSLTYGSLSTDKCISLITMIFSNSNQAKITRNLSRNDAQAVIDKIDEVMDSLTPQVHRNCLRYLSEICSSQALLPRSMEIQVRYDPTEEPFSRGGLADVWKDQWQGQSVAVRVYRMWSGGKTENIRARFRREIVTWRALHHPNVLPFLGVEIAENRLAMVSEWMQRGNIREFIKADPTVDRLGLLRGVARGLIYMHNRGITHGDLRGVKILIDSEGCARLTGLNLVTIVSEQSNVATTLQSGDKIPWMSPELLESVKSNPIESLPTKKSDCYSLGMVVYEVLSGQDPFSSYSAVEVTRMVLQGIRPEQPQGEGGQLFTGEIWELLQCCWKKRPGRRPNAKGVLARLKGNLSPSWAPDTDGDTDTDSDNRSVSVGRGSPTMRGQRRDNLKESLAGLTRNFSKRFKREGSR